MTSIQNRRLDLALTILRVVVGATFIAHGAQKLFVYGFAGVSGAFAQMGIPAAGVVGPAIALVEFLGGIALVVGLLTRFAASGIAATMAGAIFFVHLKNGFFAPTGIEFPLSLLASATVLAIAGAGDWSLDAVLARRGGTTTKGQSTRGIRRAA